MMSNQNLQRIFKFPGEPLPALAVDKSSCTARVMICVQRYENQAELANRAANLKQRDGDPATGKAICSF